MKKILSTRVLVKICVLSNRQIKAREEQNKKSREKRLFQSVE